MIRVQLTPPMSPYGRCGRLNVAVARTSGLLSAMTSGRLRTGNALDNRQRIHRLEAEMLKMTGEHLSLEVRHYFSRGLYAREMFIPKGVVLTGKIHKYESLSVVSKGKISVFTEDGISVIEAPHTVVARAGTKRVGYALEDTIWTTIHATNETDLDKLETELIAKSYDEPALLGNAVALTEET